jgi:hypothetical protein
MFRSVPAQATTSRQWEIEAKLAPSLELRFCLSKRPLVLSAAEGRLAGSFRCVYIGGSGHTPGCEHSEMLTTSKSLPSASELPIIVAMKMWIGIGAEQDGEQSLRQHCSVNPPSSWSPRGLATSGTPPINPPAEYFLRRGAACCARFSAADRRRSLTTTRSIPAIASWPRLQPQPARPQTPPATEKRAKLRDIPPFLPGSGPKVEVIENKPLNPVYPVLELHDVTQPNCRVPSASH